MAKSNYLEKKILDHVLGVEAFPQPAGVYVALFTTATGDDGSGTEVTGGGYARQPSTWAAATSGVGATSNDADIVFPNMPEVTVTHIALYDAASGGNMLYHGPLSTPQVVASGNTFVFSAGDIDITES